MYKWCLFVACLACAGHGRRLKATLEQHVSSQDVEGQKPMKQRSSDAAGYRSYIQANRSGSAQFDKNMADPRKAIPILLTFLFPAVVVAPFRNGIAVSSNIQPLYPTKGYSFNRPMYGNTQKPISSNPAGADPGQRAVVMDQNYAEEPVPYYWGPTVHVVVSVYWEGLYLRKQNLGLFKDFREAHPEVPLTHFLNAAYFTKDVVQSFHESGADQAFSPIDELGLQISGLKSLVEYSGVQFRPERLGYEADIRAYSVAELQAIISKSKAILEKQGLKLGKSFRVGAWLAGPNALEAFRREGFRVNSSAVGLDKAAGNLSLPEKIFWRDTPLSAVLNELWPGVTKESQPFLVETPVGYLVEMPDTGGSAGHATGMATVEDVVDHIDTAVQQLGAEDRFVQIGFHQETAAAYGPRVIAAIKEIKRKHGGRVVFETLQASARRARSTHRFMELEAKI